MSRSKPKLNEEQLKEYDRSMLRASFASLFWSVISELKKRRGYKLQHLADELECDKSTVSRWFSGNKPNWTLNTISDLAHALNVELRIEAVDRETKTVHTPQGQSAQYRIDPELGPQARRNSVPPLIRLPAIPVPGWKIPEAAVTAVVSFAGGSVELPTQVPNKAA